MMSSTGLIRSEAANEALKARAVDMKFEMNGIRLR